MKLRPYLWTLPATALALVVGVSCAAENCVLANGWLEPAAAKSRSIPANKLLARVADRDFVLLGEHHSDPDHHRWQAQTLAGLYAHRPEMVIGFEMFPRRLQPVLDRWVAGKLTVRDFLAESEWEKVWSFPAELYLPLFEFARINRIPMIALNVERSLTKAIGEKGWDNVPASERAVLSRPAPPVAAYRDFLLKVYREHESSAGRQAAKPGEADQGFENFVEAQLTWDRAMAEGLASRAGPAKIGSKPLVVGIIGNGHLRYGYGVPHQLRALGYTQIATLLPRAEAMACNDLDASLADAVFSLPTAAPVPPQPPRLGLALEDAEGSVRVQAIIAGGLAERSGLVVGDRLIEIAGSPPINTLSVISIIRRQPPGTWLPLRIQRGETALDLVVRFPAQT